MIADVLCSFGMSTAPLQSYSSIPHTWCHDYENGEVADPALTKYHDHESVRDQNPGNYSAAVRQHTIAVSKGQPNPLEVHYKSSDLKCWDVAAWVNLEKERGIRFNRRQPPPPQAQPGRNERRKNNPSKPTEQDKDLLWTNILDWIR